VENFDATSKTGTGPPPATRSRGETAEEYRRLVRASPPNSPVFALPSTPLARV
jgi:hypothetical protein